MRNTLTMGEYSVQNKVKVHSVSFGGLSRLSTAASGQLREASNVSTANLPALEGHGALLDYSVVSSGAIYQYLLFAVDSNMYLIAYDGSYLQLYLITGQNKYKHVFSFPGKLTEEEAVEKVKCVVYCGFDYGDNRGRRVIIYPLGYSATVNEETGELEGFLNLDDYCDYNVFHSATLHQKRIFATDGVKIYASQTESVIEFLPDATKTDENAPWAGTVHHDGMSVKPILGVTVFDSDVYYFCRNAFGRVWGGGNPFRTEQLFSVGTVDFQSVKVLAGKLYFLCETGLMVYDGQKLNCVSDALGIKKFRCGIGAVYDGQYYLVPNQDGQTDVIYTYSPSTDSWGCIPYTYGRIDSLAVGVGGVYVLSEGQEYLYNIYLISDTKSGFTCQTVYREPGSMASDRPIGVRLRVKFGTSGSLDAALTVLREDGREEKYRLFTDATGSGVTVLSKRLGGISGAAFGMELAVKGDVLILGYEILFAKEDAVDEF